MKKRGSPSAPDWIEALLASAASGRPVRLAPAGLLRHPEPSEALAAPPVDEPEPVHAEAPPQGS